MMMKIPMQFKGKKKKIYIYIYIYQRSNGGVNQCLPVAFNLPDEILLAIFFIGINIVNKDYE